VSTGPCIGHISPEALAGGPVGKLRDGDTVAIRIDRGTLSASVDLVGEGGEEFSAEEGARRLAARKMRGDLRPHPELPDDTRLWAALVEASGGVWGGCVYDVDAITTELNGEKA
jgi:xylonate dehydratase